MMPKVFQESDFADSPKPKVFTEADFAPSDKPKNPRYQALNEMAKKGVNAVGEVIDKTPLMRALQAGADVGSFADKGNQALAGLEAEAGGYIGSKIGGPEVPVPFHPGQSIPATSIPFIASGGTLATASEFSLPKTKSQAAGTALAALAPAEKLAESVYRNPTKSQRILAEVASTQSGVKPQHLAAVIANPEIMSDATPSMKEVGKEYQAVFKDLGMKFDNKAYQEITGMRYAPTETQISKLQNILGDAASKLENPDPTKPLTAAEAFLARSAGKKVLQGTISPMAKGQITADIAAMDDYLENNGIPQIKELGQKYFRAAAKESLSDILPRNKRGDPAVVRSLLMAHYGKEAIAALAEGKAGKAAVSAGAGALMSPAVQGKIIPFVAGGPGQNATQAAAIGAPQSISAIRALFEQRKKDEYGQ